MKQILSVLFLGLLVTQISCNNATSPEANTGTLTGFISVENSDGSYSRVSGVTASLVGKNLSGQTDASGIWTIHNVPAGVYRVAFSYPDHFSDTSSVFQFVGSDTFEPQNLCGPLRYNPGV